MKDIELKLICELLKNSRRSDRELAKTLGVSQPTIGRLIRKLEKEGYIREYTIVPDFKKLGFEMMTVLLSKMKPDTLKSLQQTRTRVREVESKYPSPVLMGMTGMGFGFDRVALWLSENYAEYAKSIEMIKQHPYVDVDSISGFTVDLNQSHFMPLTFSSLAEYLERKVKKQKSKT